MPNAAAVLEVSESKHIAQLTTAVFTAAFEPVKKQIELVQKTTRTYGRLQVCANLRIDAARTPASTSDTLTRRAR